MTAQPGTEIARCENCDGVIREEHPYTWCADCGTPLPATVTVRLASRAASVPGAEAPARNDVNPGVRASEWTRTVDRRLKALEERLPDSDIIHQSFWRRAWTVFGYNVSTMATIYAVIFAVALLIQAFK